MGETQGPRVKTGSPEELAVLRDRVTNQRERINALQRDNKYLRDLVNDRIPKLELAQKAVIENMEGQVSLARINLNKVVSQEESKTQRCLTICVAFVIFSMASCSALQAYVDCSNNSTTKEVNR